MAEKVLPQSMEAEMGVLGSVIIDPDMMAHVADMLTPEDFYRDAHRHIYKVMLTQYEQHLTSDLITISDELARENKLEDVGGSSYITSLINGVPTSGNVEYYANIVKEKASVSSAHSCRRRNCGECIRGSKRHLTER